MKNKKILYFLLIIFCVFNLNKVFAEEIVFETPEIITFENGNILKASKGGKALIGESTEITANQFEYNKITKILIAIGNAKALDIINKVTIEADELIYNKQKLLFTAKGNAKAIDTLNKTTINADELEYNKQYSKYTAKKNVKVHDTLNNVFTEAEKISYLTNEKKIFSEGKTIIFIEKKYKIKSTDVTWLKNKNEFSSEKFSTFEDDENNFYTTEKFRYLTKKKLLRANKVTLNSNDRNEYFFEDALINIETNELHGKDLLVNFDKGMFGNEENEPRLKGNKAFSNVDVTTVSKGVFTTCKKRPNEKCPPWKIQANEAKHDKKKKTIYYKNAWLKVYDVPVLYYPYFFHPDPTVTRQSGFLTPQLGESQTLGLSAYIPYFYVISDRQDLTLKPRIYTDKISIQSEYRKAGEKAKHIVDFSLTQGHDSSKNDKDDARSHFFSNSYIDLSMSSFDISNLEIQVQKSSNDTYLKLFDLESPLFGDNETSGEVSTLNSFIKLNATRADLDFKTSIEVYEKFDKANSDRYEFVFPSYSLNKIIDTQLKGALSFNSSGSNHMYDTNISEAQIINDLLYKSEDKYLASGIKNNYNILLKNVNSDANNSKKISNKLKTELLSSFIFESSYPLVREGINFNDYFTPKVSLRYSPNKMKNLKDEDVRVDINNIFSIDRIGFSNTVESGQSLTIGTEYKKYKKTNNDFPEEFFDINLATVFRTEFNEDIPTSTSIGNKSSDVVGQIRFLPNSFFSSNYYFTVDNSIDQIKYQDISARFTVNNFITSFKYIEDTIGSKNYLQNTTSYKFNENNYVLFSTRRNKKIDLTEYYDLVYQYKNDCLTASINYNKEFYSDKDIEPTQQLFFSLTIVPLGTYESKNLLTNPLK